MKKPGSRRALALRWSPRAVANLDEIIARFDSESVLASDNFQRDLFRAIEGMAAFPGIGRVPNDYDWRASGFAELRELLVWDYRVAYAIESDHIDVVYLVHARRHFPPIDRG